MTHSYIYVMSHTPVLANVERLERLTEQLDMCAKKDKHLINEQSRTLEHLRKKNLEQHALILKMQSRLQELEPVKCSTPQPLFARR